MKFLSLLNPYSHPQGKKENKIWCIFIIKKFFFLGFYHLTRYELESILSKFICKDFESGLLYRTGRHQAIFESLDISHSCESWLDNIDILFETLSDRYTWRFVCLCVCLLSNMYVPSWMTFQTTNVVNVTLTSNKQGSFFCFFLFVSEICSLFPTNIDSNSIWLGNMSLTTKVGAFSISLFSIWLWVNLHLACLLCEDQILILTHISGDYKNLQAFSCVWTAFHNRVLFDFYIWCLDPNLSCCRLQGKVFSFQAHYFGHEIFDVVLFPILSPPRG